MKNLQIKMQSQFDKICQTGKLFRSSVPGDQIWEFYINGFKDDPVFRDPGSSEHNCNLCKNFIRRYGNIVAIDNDLSIMTIWDIETEDEYKDSCERVSEILKRGTIRDVFFETYNELHNLNYESCNKSFSQFALGISKNHKRYTKEEAEKFGVVKPNEIKTFHHLSLKVPRQFVDTGNISVEALMARYRDAKEVFKRGMDEISLEALTLVRDLINQDSLLDGKTHLHKVLAIIPLKEEYDKLPTSLKDNWCWVNSYGCSFAKFKNELIGVLCSDISSGADLNKACQDWNKRVDPANYMKVKAPITQRQIEMAKQFVIDNGYEQSFIRRCATIEDIKASEILHLNVGDGNLRGVSIFDEIKPTLIKSKPIDLGKIEEVTIDQFMTNILPTCSSVEAYLRNSHEGNMVSLTTSDVDSSKSIFKWSNNYSWTYNGNLAGKSMIKQAVKSAGGTVEAPFRFSIMWNEDGRDRVDFDAHAVLPNRSKISFNNKHDGRTLGCLDVDMIRPSKLGVENIYWQDKSKLIDGKYNFSIHNYDGGNNKGFKAQIEINGKVFNYTYTKEAFGTTIIAVVTLKEGELVDIDHRIPVDNSEEVSTNIYGLDTNQFHKVNLVCLSPNHWSDNNIGNKHYFFMLENCKFPNKIRSFHNENLIPELLTHYKGVMEVLGLTTQIESKDNQLSGLGFNATVRDELIVRIDGTHRRVLKIKF